jgi:hypothetical protein
VPIFDLPSRQLPDQGGAERRQDVGLGGPAGVIDRLGAAALQFLQVVSDGLRHGIWAGSRVVALFAPDLRAPPFAGGLLRMAEIQYRYPISVLQIVRGSDFVLDVGSPSSPPAGKPRTAICPAPIAERQPLFDRAPVRFGLNWKPQPGGSAIQLRVANSARHLPAWTNGKVLGSIRRRTSGYHNGL